ASAQGRFRGADPIQVSPALVWRHLNRADEDLFLALLTWDHGIGSKLLWVQFSDKRKDCGIAGWRNGRKRTCSHIYPPKRNSRRNLIKRTSGPCARSFSLYVAIRWLQPARRDCNSTTGWPSEQKLQAPRQLPPDLVPRSIEA